MKKFALVQFSSCRGDHEIDKVERFEAECLADTYERFGVDLRGEAVCVAAGTSTPTWQELVCVHGEHCAMLGGEETFAFIVELIPDRASIIREHYGDALLVTHLGFESFDIFERRTADACLDRVAWWEETDYAEWVIMPS